jgi:hypothetical protein
VKHDIGFDEHSTISLNAWEEATLSGYNLQARQNFIWVELIVGGMSCRKTMNCGRIPLLSANTIVFAIANGAFQGSGGVGMMFSLFHLIT